VTSCSPTANHRAAMHVANDPDPSQLVCVS
jgi:hypothetical protein